MTPLGNKIVAKVGLCSEELRLVGRRGATSRVVGIHDRLDVLHDEVRMTADLTQAEQLHEDCIEAQRSSQQHKGLLTICIILARTFSALNRHDRLKSTHFENRTGFEVLGHNSLRAATDGQQSYSANTGPYFSKTSYTEQRIS